MFTNSERHANFQVFTALQMRIQFRYTTPCHWVIGSRRCEKTSETDYPVTRCHNAEERTR